MMKRIAELYIGDMKRYFRREVVTEFYHQYKWITLTAEPSCFVDDEPIFSATGYMFVFEKIGDVEQHKTKLIQKYLLSEIWGDR